MHVAIIMDGNGRWAARRGLPRIHGHRHGAKAVREVVEAAVRVRLDTLTLYAFSSDNWGRPSAEVAALMRLLRRYLMSETSRCLEQSVRFNIIGRRDRLSPQLLHAIERSEAQTRHCNGLLLRIAVDYSARATILRAAGAASAADTRSVEDFHAALARADHSVRPVGAVDLLIRAGGEKRLSDFLLWECAYAELHFSEVLWPDFGPEELTAALADFGNRQRRYGALPEATPSRVQS